MTTLSELVRLQQEATPRPWRSNREGFAALAQDNTVAMRAGPHSLMVGSVGEAFSNVEFAVDARNFDFSGLQQKHENEIFAAQNVSRIYFEIAAEAVGEEKARAMFDERFEALRASLDTKARGDG